MNFEHLAHFTWKPLSAPNQVLVIDPFGSTMMVKREADEMEVYLPHHQVVLPHDRRWGLPEVLKPTHELHWKICGRLPRRKRPKMDLLEELHDALDQAMGPASVQRRQDMEHLFWIAYQDRVQKGYRPDRSITAHKNQYFWTYATPRLRLLGGHAFRAMGTMLRDWHRDQDHLQWIHPSQFLARDPDLLSAHERLAWKGRLLALLQTYKADPETLAFYAGVDTSF